MTDILAGATIKAVDRPAAVFAQDLSELSNQSNTTFQPGSPVVDVTFTAATSGRVMLVVGAGVRDDAGPSPVGIVTAEIYEGTDATGTLVVAAENRRHALICMRAALFQQASRASVVEGLTPGATHYARVVHQVTSGSTVDFTVRDLSIIPAT